MVFLSVSERRKVCMHLFLTTPDPWQDFRDAVAKTSRLSGKPVIEERILNQILYYLPQLYELNRDLLRELEERVACWYRNRPLLHLLD